MSNAIKDAAERLRSHYDYMKASGATTEFDLFAYQLTGSPYYDTDWKMIHGGRLREDETLLAKAYLMENDETLITPEWLATTDLEINQYGEYSNEYFCLSPWQYDDDNVTAYSTELSMNPDLNTRGELRLVAKLFGITIIEKGVAHAN